MDKENTEYSKFIMCDNDKCVGCKKCEVACSTYHTNNNKIKNQNRIFVRKLKNEYNVYTCMQCENAPCMDVCPYDDIKRVNGNIYIDEKNCIACGKCVKKCPIKAIQIKALVENGKLLKRKGNKYVLTAIKCDMCIGNKLGPVCISICEEGALKLINYEES